MARLVERSYMALLLERDPEYYTNTRPSNRVAYKFSNGREFTDREPYAGGYLYGVEYRGELVFWNGEMVTYETDALLRAESLVEYLREPIDWMGEMVAYEPRAD